MEDSQVYVRDGKIIVDEHELALSGVMVERKVAEGDANGSVFVGSDTLLSRKVAIKIWRKLRTRDNRDKLEQGMLEARKAWDARGSSIIQLYTAGLAGRHIYTIMEYIDGVTLRDWLDFEKPAFGLRLTLAWYLVAALQELELKYIRHGDLHDQNVLIYKRPWVVHYMADRRPSGDSQPAESSDSNSERWQVVQRNEERYYFKIIDFGTSYFSSQIFSSHRHYDLIEKTIDNILAPLKIKLLYDDLRPKKYDNGNFLGWMLYYIVMICASLTFLSIGRFCLPPSYAIHPDMGLEWSYFNDDRSKRFLAQLREFIAHHSLFRTEIEGDPSSWHSNFAG